MKVLEKLRYLFGRRKKLADPFKTTEAFNRFARSNALMISREMARTGNFPPPMSHDALMAKYVHETGRSPFVVDDTPEKLERSLRETGELPRR